MSVDICSGGYDYRFFEEPPDSLKCLICLLVAKDPQQHGGCGKLFCKTCIAKYSVHNDDCPHCRQLLSKSTGIFNDFKSDQEVKSLRVLCTKSCGWAGELRDLEEHNEKKCLKAQMLCPNKCLAKIMRMNLDSHLKSKCPRRQHQCPQCKQQLEYRFLQDHLYNKCPKRRFLCPNCRVIGFYDERTTTHLNVCSKVRIECPNCSLKTFRCDQMTHLEVCPKVIIECLNCCVKMFRRDLTTHLDICPKVKIECPKCLVQIFRCECSTHSLTCTHEPVLCKYFNIGCMEKPLRKDVHTHEEDAQLHLAIATAKVLQLTNTTLLENSGTFKLTDFNNKRTNNLSFFSPQFASSRFGYKLCLCVVANGYQDGKGTHVSVGVYLMKGNNDDSLTWPFTGTVTIELLNQLEDRNHHKMTATFLAESEASKRVVNGERASIGFGHPQFISHKNLDFKSSDNCQYLNDDSLIFRVSVEVPNYKPWLECTM